MSVWMCLLDLTSGGHVSLDVFVGLDIRCSCQSGGVCLALPHVFISVWMCLLDLTSGVHVSLDMFVRLVLKCSCQSGYVC